MVDTALAICFVVADSDFDLVLERHAIRSNFPFRYQVGESLSSRGELVGTWTGQMIPSYEKANSKPILSMQSGVESEFRFRYLLCLMELSQSEDRRLLEHNDLWQVD